MSAARRWRWSAVGLLLAVGLAAAAMTAARWPTWRADRSLRERLAAIQPIVPGAVPSCPPADRAPLVLLVLGQSNAGNHAAENEPPPAGEPPSITVFQTEGCVRVADPLPGATGTHRSLWSRLEPELAAAGTPRTVIAALLAVDGTRIDDWVRPSSPLVPRLQSLLAAMSASGVSPDLVLWQQGEGDALDGSSTSAYLDRFERLRTALREAGVRAPMLLARSTLCGRADGAAVREAVTRLAARHADVRLGPDTDSLTGDARVGGCHFSRAGRDAAAKLWVESLRPLLQ